MGTSRAKATCFSGPIRVANDDTMGESNDGRLEGERRWRPGPPCADHLLDRTTSRCDAGSPAEVRTGRCSCERNFQIGINAESARELAAGLLEAADIMGGTPGIGRLN
jgi:hypothetical protein